MACAHAKFTGEVGVCLATSGPGAIHLAQWFIRRQARSSTGRGHRRPAKTRRARAATTSRKSISFRLFKDVAHEYVHMVIDPDANAPYRRPRHAHRSGRAQACAASSFLTIFRRWRRKSPHANTAPSHSGIGYNAPRVVPEPRICNAPPMCSMPARR